MTASSQPDDADDRPRCACHGEAMYWQKTPRLAAGGFWECGVARRAWSKAHYEKVREERLEGLREKYDNDPLFRLTKNFRRVVRDRERRIQRLQQEGLDGALQIEG